ncbi:proton gradient regulation 5, chloroplastic-like protein [Tanacetum coccineum]
MEDFVLPFTEAGRPGEDYSTMLSKTTQAWVKVSGKPFKTLMGNVSQGKELFAPALVITQFCKSIGADWKQQQGLIRIAKKNGEKLGFLAYFKIHYLQRIFTFTSIVCIQIM